MNNNNFFKFLFGAFFVFSFLTNGILDVEADSPPTLSGGENIIQELHGETGNIESGSIRLSCPKSMILDIKFSYDGSEFDTYQSDGLTCSSSGSVVLHNTLPVDMLRSKPEHTFAIKIVSYSDSDGSNFVSLSGNEVTYLQNILVVENGTFTTSDGLFSFEGWNIPIGTTFSLNKEADQSVIDKVGTTDVYKFETSTGGKSFSQLANKYSNFALSSGGYISSIASGTLRLPSNLTPSFGLFAYVYSKDLSKNTPIIDCTEDSPDSCNGEFGYFSDINLLDGGYIAFRKGVVDLSTNPVADSTSEETLNNVPNTAANIKLFIFIIGGLFAVVGGSLISKSLSSDIY